MRALKPRKGKLMTGEEALAEALAFEALPQYIRIAGRSHEDLSYSDLYMVQAYLSWSEARPRLAKDYLDRIEERTREDNFEAAEDRETILRANYGEATFIAQQFGAQLLTPRQYIDLLLDAKNQLLMDHKGNRFSEDLQQRLYREFANSCGLLNGKYRAGKDGLEVVYTFGSRGETHRLENYRGNGELEDQIDFEDFLKTATKLGLPSERTADGNCTYDSPQAGSEAMIMNGLVCFNWDCDDEGLFSQPFRLAFTEENFRKYLKREVTKYCPECGVEVDGWVATPTTCTVCGASYGEPQ